MKFYKCRHCGNIVAFVEDRGGKLVCCGEVMQEIIAGTVDASHEKHTPVVTVNDSIVHVEVGSIIHPMTQEHFIGWIALETTKGNQRKLITGDMPHADFKIFADEEVISAYAYCNLHGLWKS